MERKEIYTVVIAALGIILVIGLLSLFTKPDSKTQQNSMPAVTGATAQQSNASQTDIWDYLREQNTTTVTTETTAIESAVTTDTLPEGAETLPTQEGIEIPIVSGEITQSETTTATETVTTVDNTPPEPYHFVIS